MASLVNSIKYLQKKKNNNRMSHIQTFLEKKEKMFLTHIYESCITLILKSYKDTIRKVNYKTMSLDKFYKQNIYYH